MKKQLGFYDGDPFLILVFAFLILAVVASYFFQDLEIVSPEPLSPLVKQEIREAVKDGIQASRAEELQQLRQVQNPPASPRNIHF
ncbi:hypothetical protein [Alcanivorax sp.]|uniref:hypothetical protein n=1 Tax=Alcanivorax sp. TaxID=1872427 RepID=UPI000C0F37EC|nr:hypothetical protein [Alcanivorax sp.]PHR67264.1 MAG: hypothetical protein COA55_07720 [Alcanivorax sp.]